MFGILFFNRMDGGQLTARILSEHGVRHIFTLCGGHISPVLAGCKGEGIRVIDVRQEATAVFAADVYSRLSGIPGVAVVTAGPGITNTITALKNAQMAQSALILLGGATATIHKGRGSLQDIDQHAVVKSSVKWHASAQRLKDIPKIFNDAFAIAKKGVPGPVFVELPVDLLYAEKTVREWYQARGGNKNSVKDKIRQWYINRHLNYLFANSRSIKGLPVIKPSPAHPLPGEIKKAVKFLIAAKKPLLLLGSQVAANPEKVSAMVHSVESLGIPVFLSGMARGLLGKDHPLQVRHHRKEALRQADCIVMAGVSCDFRLDFGRPLGSKAKIIAVNFSKTDLYRNMKPDLAILADPCIFLTELGKQSGSLGVPAFSAFAALLKKADQARENEIAVQERFKAEGINPLLLLRKLDNCIEENSLLVADGGDFVASASYIVRPRKPLGWLDPGVFGTLGAGAGFALAAGTFNPSSPVWIIYGDGSFGYSLAEFDTFVRHKIPVIAIVGNDGCWSQIERDQVEILKDDVGTKSLRSDYHLAVKGLGAEGILLKDETKIEDVFSEAKKIAATGKPVLINAMIGKTDFRKGSISM